MLTKVIIYDNIKEWRLAAKLQKWRLFMKKNMTPRESLVQQLKETRREIGMTQQELAELAGTKKSNISRLESGRYNPSLDFLIKIADGLGKQIEITIQ